MKTASRLTPLSFMQSMWIRWDSRAKIQARILGFSIYRFSNCTFRSQLVWLRRKRDKLCWQTASVPWPYCTKCAGEIMTRISVFAFFVRCRWNPGKSARNCVRLLRRANTGRGINRPTSLPLAAPLPSLMEEKAKTRLCLVRRCVHRGQLWYQWNRAKKKRLARPRDMDPLQHVL